MYIVYNIVVMIWTECVGVCDSWTYCRKMLRRPRAGEEDLEAMMTGERETVLQFLTPGRTRMGGGGGGFF